MSFAQRVETFFLTLRDLPDEERAAHLRAHAAKEPRVVAEVQALLEVPDDAIEQLLPDGGAAACVEPDERPGDRIGRYELLEQIGEGGFGTVWRAEQHEPVRRQVALKVIKRGMDQRQILSRFDSERQALAIMDHPCIAKVLDGGATESGRPYFVMELVHGEPLHVACDRQRLDTRQRLLLFVQVCEAIQHAHQKGIIHRDLKPSNVLVTLHDGVPVPKVIDFGVAKALDRPLTDATVFTEVRQMVGTPEYMAPEQAEMSGLAVDTRTDVYALGVLLYEMLTGANPFVRLRERGMLEMLRTIREEDPPKPSTHISTLGDGLEEIAQRRHTPSGQLTRQLRGELDWIVMKALEKDRERRYDGAKELADDIRRHLADEPVLAGPPSAAYRLRKLARRYRGQVVAAAAILLTLVAGVVVSAWFAVDARDQAALAKQHQELAEKETARAQASEREATALREEADVRARELEQVSSFQSAQLASVNAAAMGAQLRDSILAAVPEADRESMAAGIAAINFTNLGLDILRDHVIAPSIAAIDRQFEDQPLVRARLLYTAGMTLSQLGLHADAVAPLRRALDIRRAELGDEHIETLDIINSLAMVYCVDWNWSLAEPLRLEVLDTARRTLPADHPFTLTCMFNLAALRWMQNRSDEAERLHREVLEKRRRVLGDEHEDTLLTIATLGSRLGDRGRLVEAETYLEEVIASLRKKLGPDDPLPWREIFRLARLRLSMSSVEDVGQQHTEPEGLYREALAGVLRELGSDHPETLQIEQDLAALLSKQGRLAEAEELARRVVAERIRTQGTAHSETLGAQQVLAQVLLARGRGAEAEQLLREVVEGRRRLGEDSLTFHALYLLGQVLETRGKPAQVETVLREALEIGSTRPFEMPHCIAILCTSLGKLGRAAEAIALFEAQIARVRSEDPENHARIGEYLHQLQTLVASFELTRIDIRSFREVGIRCGKELVQLDDADPRTLSVGATARSIRIRRYNQSAWVGGWLLAQAREADAATARRLVGEAEPYLVRAAELIFVEWDTWPVPLKGRAVVASRLAELYELWQQLEPEAGHEVEAKKWRERLARPVGPDTAAVRGELTRLRDALARLPAERPEDRAARRRHLRAVMLVVVLAQCESPLADQAVPPLQTRMPEPWRYRAENAEFVRWGIEATRELLAQIEAHPDEAVDGLPAGDQLRKQAEVALGWFLLAQASATDAAAALPMVAESAALLVPITERDMTSTHAKNAPIRVRSAALLVTLHETWDALEPGAGHDAQAEHWRERLGAAEAEVAEIAAGRQGR